MALGISITPLRAPSGSLFKGRKVKLVKFTGDNAKPTAGYTLTPSNLNLRVIEGVVMGNQADQNLLWAMSIDSTVSSVSSSASTAVQATLQAYTAVGSGGNATASATIVSTAVVTAMVYGF
jgi:hypothetical protein